MTISRRPPTFMPTIPSLNPGTTVLSGKDAGWLLVQVPDVKSVPVVKSAPTYFTTTVDDVVASVPDPITRSLVTSLLGGGGVPGLMTGWTWRFVGSATAGADVVDAPVVEVVDVLPLVFEVWEVPDAGLESVVDGELFGDDEGLLPQPARTSPRSNGAAMRRRRTAEEYRASGGPIGIMQLRFGVVGPLPPKTGCRTGALRRCRSAGQVEFVAARRQRQPGRGGGQIHACSAPCDRLSSTSTHATRPHR